MITFSTLATQRLIIGTICGLMAVSVVNVARAESSPFSTDQKAAIQEIIRTYLLEHPEVLMESVQAYQEREQAAEDTKRSQGLSSRKEQLFNDPSSPVIGNPKGDVTLIEFFDYQCGYCKSVRESLLGLINQDKNIRLVMKEFPILSPASTLAAKAALASHEQGKYWEFHNLLMGNRGPLNEESIMRLARSISLDTDRLRKDMESSQIAAALDNNRKLAEALSLHGTPAFIIGDKVIPGAVDLDSLKRLVAVERKK
ncbi:DsbA family protein [Azospirillaceae bacterium]